MLRLLVPVLAMSLLTGCSGRWVYSDYREIDQMELIQVLGMDEEGGKITVTASTGGPGEPVVLRSTSVSISRAMRQMQDYTSRKYIFFGHTAHLLLGESAAAGGVDPYLEHMERSVEMRLNTFLYVVRVGTAQEAVSAAGQEEDGAVDLLTSLEKDVQLMSESHVFTCGETAEMLAERGCCLAAAVSLVRQEDILSGEDPVTLAAEGYAILKEGKLAGYLDPDLARGANLLMDLGGEDILEVPDGRGSWAALRLIGSRVRYLPEYREGELASLRIRVELDCSLDELRSPGEAGDREIPEQLKKGAEQLELERIRRVLERSRALGADFCGVGQRVRAVRPLAFDGMARSWAERFPELPLEAEVSCRIIQDRHEG
jgi:spore germination protein KC